MQNLNTKETMARGVIVLNVSEMPQENISVGKGQNYLLVGDNAIWLKKIPDNSIDSIVTDPPAGISFMGRGWDTDKGGRDHWIAWMQEVATECKRVLKPGGHAFVWAIPRTSHWTATAWENAGFEIRDVVAHIFGSGFPKSLNIGKAVDKLQGNEREVVGTTNSKGIRSGANNIVGDSYKCDGYDATKGTSEWEGWGTALKPAREDWLLMRKPLGQQELDIAKNICYNIIEKGFITNSKIIWRINNVKSAEKQKTKQSSTPTQQQKMVVVSAEFVETKENESVGKKIQKLIENICESTVKKTAKKQTKELQNTTEQIEKEYSNLIKPIKENEKRTQSKNMGVNVSAVEKQTLSSLPLTTLEVEEDSTEKKSKMETSMSSLKSTDTQKTDTDYSAQTATFQWVCMDIVRTIKVPYNGKEYDFIELTDGSLVWNENLEPYRKQQKLNVAENCLKYGTGGINIDESRVEGNELIETGRAGRSGASTFNASIGEEQPAHSKRFPANLIHDNSEEVRECFPNESERFFKSIIYQAKASKSERNKGCEELEDVVSGTRTNERTFSDDFREFGDGVSSGHKNLQPQKNNHPTVKPIALMEYLIKMVTPTGGIVLDPFAGSGSTLVAAKQNGYQYIGIEMTEEYIPIIKARLNND